MQETDFYNLVKKLSLGDDTAEKELTKIIQRDLSSLSIIVKLTYSQIWTSRDRVAHLLISLGKIINPQILGILSEDSPDDLKKWCLFIMSHTAESKDVLKILEINTSWPENLISESLEYVASRVDVKNIDKLVALLNHSSRKIQKSVFNALFRLVVLLSEKNADNSHNISVILDSVAFLINHRDLDFQYWGIKLLDALPAAANLDLMHSYLKRKKWAHLFFLLSRYSRIRVSLREQCAKEGNNIEDEKKLNFIDSIFRETLSGERGWYLQKELISQLQPPFSTWEEQLLFSMVETDNILISPMASAALAKTDSHTVRKLFKTIKKTESSTLKWKLKAILDSDYDENIDTLCSLDENSALDEDEASLMLECIGKKALDIDRALNTINRYAASDHWFLRYKAIEALDLLSSRKKDDPSFKNKRDRLAKTLSKALKDNNDLIRSRALGIIF